MDNNVQFVNEFSYLGHVLTNNLRDDTDVNREIRNMYMKTNMLIQRFRRCSTHVKIVLLGHFVYVFMVLHYGLVIEIVLC